MSPLPFFRSTLCLLAATAVATAAETSVPRAAVADFLEFHCYDCHGDGMKKGGLALDGLADGLNDPEAHATWVKVFDRVRRGEMPPKDKDRPKQAESDAFLKKLSTSLAQADRQRYARQGRTVLRRLNRDEYENTLRDVLALPHLQIKQELPADAEAHGFDNVSEALRISYVQMARYLSAAEKALLEAAWLAPAPKRYKFRLPFVDMHRYRTTHDRVTVGGEAVLLRQPNTAQTPWRVDVIQIPFPGTHTLRIRARAVTYSQDSKVPEGNNKFKKGQKQVTDHGKLLPPQRPQILSVYQGTRFLGSMDLTEKPTVGEIEAHLHVGRSARADDEHRLILYVPTMQDWGPKWKNGAYTGPAVALDWIEVEGPAENDSPTAAYQVLFDKLPVRLWDKDKDATLCDAPPAFGELKHPKRHPKLDGLPRKGDRFMVDSKRPEADARRLLKRFMERAFRTPVPAGEVDRYMPLVRAALKAKKPFHLAMIDGYRAVLTSPDFLYFLEGGPGPLSPDALASRLSYFLWASPPDAELRSAAKGDADELAAQVDRLLEDPRAERFIDRFTGQWLGLHEINFTQPDKKLYPEYDDQLKESMVAETRAYFRAMLTEDLPARHVIDSDFAFVNETLARLYGIPDVKGVKLRRVKLSANSPRGGLITQASFLKITANGTTTSPVIRGTWVLDRLLGSHPPPPPPNVPAVEPDTRGATTIRQLLDKHRADPACASCHAKIDPPGFALESFDVIGGWRDRYRSLEQGDGVDKLVDGRRVQYKHALPVDSTGVAPEGASFKDIHGFKKILLKDERRLARNLAERLLVHATGAGVSFADRAEVEKILDRAESKGYGLRTLIREIVRCETFRRK